MKQIMDDLSISMHEMHREVSNLKETLRGQAQKFANKNLKKVEYYESDYVLLRTVDPKTKTLARSIVYLITKIVSDHVCMVKHLITGKGKEVHITRLMPFNSKNIDLRLLKENVGFNTEYEVGKLLDIRVLETIGEEEVLVSWKYVDEDENTWEPLSQILEDVPELEKKLRKRISKKKSV